MRLILDRLNAAELFNTTTDGYVIYPYEEKAKDKKFDFEQWDDIAYLAWPYSCYSIIKTQENGKFPINFIIQKEMTDRIAAAGDMQIECWRKLQDAPVWQNDMARARYMKGVK